MYRVCDFHIAEDLDSEYLNYKQFECRRSLSPPESLTFSCLTV
jgi:hypothetical protein